MKLPDTIYHLAEEANWPSIQKHGLLSASELIRMSGLDAGSQVQLERSQRFASTELPSAVRIRDQRPMPPSALASCLVGALSPADWYALVNTHVFFWIDPDRLNRQRAACEPRPQLVLSICTAQLIDGYRSAMAVTPINTGNARRKPARRGAASFVPYADWVHTGWESESDQLGTPLRKRSHKPVEVTVRGSIPDAMAFVKKVSKLSSGQLFNSTSTS